MGCVKQLTTYPIRRGALLSTRSKLMPVFLSGGKLMPGRRRHGYRAHRSTAEGRCYKQTWHYSPSQDFYAHRRDLGRVSSLRIARIGAHLPGGSAWFRLNSREEQQTSSGGACITKPSTGKQTASSAGDHRLIDFARGDGETLHGGEAIRKMDRGAERIGSYGKGAIGGTGRNAPCLLGWARQ